MLLLHYHQWIIIHIYVLLLPSAPASALALNNHLVPCSSYVRFPLTCLFHLFNADNGLRITDTGLDFFNNDIDSGQLHCPKVIVFTQV